MERINVIRVSPFLSWFLTIMGALNTLYWSIILVTNINEGLNLKDPSVGLNAIIFIVQGIVFVVWGVINLYNKRFYISWDENELHLYLPDNKRDEAIKFSDIESVSIKLFEIELKLTDSVRLIDLNSVRFEDLKKIKSKFESMQKNTKSNYLWKNQPD
jgi:hypothetical protein